MGIPENKMQCRVVAKRNEPSSGQSWQWIEKGPEVISILQSSRVVHPDDIGKVTVSVRFPKATHHRFFTPRTFADKVFWSNGLDLVETLAEGFALFPNAEAACAAVARREHGQPGRV